MNSTHYINSKYIYSTHYMNSKYIYEFYTLLSGSYMYFNFVSTGLLAVFTLNIISLQMTKLIYIIFNKVINAIGMI